MKNLRILKQRLTTVGDSEPINKFAMVFIFLIDIYILSILFNGLSEHSKQLTNPREYIPYQARTVFINENWTAESRMDRLQDFILSDRINNSYGTRSTFEESEIRKMHPICRDFFENCKAIADDEKLKKQLTERDKKCDERNRILNKQRQTKQVYDTALLEKISNGETPEITAIEIAHKASVSKLELLTKEIQSISAEIEKSPKVQIIWELTDPENNHRQTLTDDLDSAERRYEIVLFLWQILFLAPLFAIFYFWNALSIKKENQIQVLISSHMLVIASIPILFKLFQLVIELIPQNIFHKIFDILEDLRLIAIWHYVVILGTIAINIFIVFLIQKKIFDKKRIATKRIEKGACTKCSRKLPENSEFCPFCGTKQIDHCKSCGKLTQIEADFCKNCGAKN